MFGLALAAFVVSFISLGCLAMQTYIQYQQLHSNKKKFNISCYLMYRSIEIYKEKKRSLKVYFLNFILKF